MISNKGSSLIHVIAWPSISGSLASKDGMPCLCDMNRKSLIMIGKDERDHNCVLITWREANAA